MQHIQLSKCISIVIDKFDVKLQEIGGLLCASARHQRVAWQAARREHYTQARFNACIRAQSTRY